MHSIYRTVHLFILHKTGVYMLPCLNVLCTSSMKQPCTEITIHRMGGAGGGSCVQINASNLGQEYPCDKCKSGDKTNLLPLSPPYPYLCPPPFAYPSGVGKMSTSTQCICPVFVVSYCKLVSVWLGTTV